MTTTAEFFDAKAATWDAGNTKSTPEKIDYILSSAGLSQSDNVLDVGTGTGVLLPHIERHIGIFGSITAVDLSPMMLAKAHEKYASLHCPTSFVLADVESDHIKGTYDRILLYCVYPHLRHPFATLHRLADQNLSPEGTITIAHPVGRDFINNVHHHCAVHSSDLPPATDLATELAEQGFMPVKIEESDEIYIVTLRKKVM